MILTFIAPSNSTHSLKWINYFNKSGIKIYWISFYKSTIEIDNKINYYECTNIFSFFKNFILFLNLFKKSSNVHLHYMGKFIWVLFFFKIKNLIVSPWGSDIKFTNVGGLKWILQKFVFVKSKTITVDAEFMNKEVLKFGNFKSKLKRINFGTDTNFFNYHTLEEKKANKKYKIISLRNLEKIYCIEDIICSLELFPLNIQNKIHLDIYGDGNERKYLESLVDSKGLNEIITFKGRYEYKNLPQILKKYDLYISSSSSDAGLAASTSEAMSSGTLVLSSDNSENIYWIKGNGLTYRTNDIFDLRDKIIDSINLNTEERKILVKNARNKIIRENDFNSEMAKMEKLYSS